jgi:hypothetical protein
LPGLEAVCAAAGESAAAGPRRRRRAACYESAFKETAPLVVEIVEELLPMLLKLWAIVIVTCAHCDTSFNRD